MPSSLNSATLDYIRTNALADVRRLALRQPPEGVDVRAALTQIEGRQLAATKLPTWTQTEGILFPPRLALEQCSSEATATYKREVVRRLLWGGAYAPDRQPTACFADLTAGFGVDFAAIAPLFAQAVYVEHQPLLCDLARHNLPLLGSRHAKVVCAEAEDVLREPTILPDPITPFALCFLDPARRDAAGRKVARIEDCTPDVTALQVLLRQRAQLILLKLSPMLDLTAAIRSLQGVAEAHVVSVGGECKELLLVVQGQGHDSLSTGNGTDIPIHCIDLHTQHATYSVQHSSEGVSPLSHVVFTRSEEVSAPYRLAKQLGTYLYEPNASLLKAGAFRLLCQRFAIEKLAPDTHLYTSQQRVTDFPGRTWHILGHSTFAKRALSAFLADTPAADLTVRGFPTSVEALRRQLHLRQGGNTHLIATTLADGTRLLIKAVRIENPHLLASPQGESSQP